MYAQIEKPKENKTKAVANSVAQKKNNGGQGLKFIDNRPEAITQRKLQKMDNNRPQVKQTVMLQAMPDTPLPQQQPIQMYKLGTGTTRTVNLKGAKGTHSFEECTYNSVEYKNGDPKVSGSTTSSPAAWATWLVNKKGGRNATQLHVVNARWGGLGGQNDKNIVPGTPAENSHHLHEAEKKFDDACFGGSGGSAAVQDAKYECTTSPSYGTAVDVSGGSQDFSDPTLSVTITTSTGSTVYPVTTGTDGLTMKEGD